MNFKLKRRVRIKKHLSLDVENNLRNKKFKERLVFSLHLSKLLR